MVDDCKGIQLVETGYNSAVFYVRQPADVEDKIWAPSDRCEFIAGALHVSVGQTQLFTGVPQTKTWLHRFPRCREETPLLRVLQNYQCVKNTEQDSGIGPVRLAT